MWHSISEIKGRGYLFGKSVRNFFFRKFRNVPFRVLLLTPTTTKPHIPQSRPVSEGICVDLPSLLLLIIFLIYMLFFFLYFSSPLLHFPLSLFFPPLNSSLRTCRPKGLKKLFWKYMFRVRTVITVMSLYLTNRMPHTKKFKKIIKKLPLFFEFWSKCNDRHGLGIGPFCANF